MAELAAVEGPCPWHQELLGQLLERHGRQALPHALLFGGPPGTGKWRLAQSLVQAMLCEAPRGGLACGQCQGCHLSAAATHPDLFRAEPEEPGKAIPVARIRALVDFAARTPQFGGARLALIRPADAMNTSAQNALLKTLEEPGSGMVVILVSDRPALLLPTIRSRCQQHLLPVPPAESAREWLAGYLSDGGEAGALLAAAGGAPLRALELEQAEWFGRRREILQALVRVAEAPRAIPEAGRVLADVEISVLVEAAWHWCARALRQLAGAPAAAHQDTGIAPLLARLAEIAGQQRLLAFSRRLLEVRRMLASGANPNPELLREQLLLALAGVDAPAVDI